MIFETGIISAEFLGSQREVLASMESKGPAILIQPLDLYNLCIHVGLLPRPVDIVSSNPNMVSNNSGIIFGLFYSRYWVIFPIENSIFFPSHQEKNPNLKLQNNKVE